MPFQKGHKKVGGRAKGTTNKETKALRDMILNTLNNLGNEKWLQDQATKDPKWKIPHMGLSMLGEIVGWAKPDFSPPRNGRTNKALHALGYSVKIN